MENFLKSTNGTTSVEYSVMVALIAMAVTGAFILLGTATAALFGTRDLPSVIGGLDFSTGFVPLVSLVAILITSAITDLHTQKIPNTITFSGMLAALSLHMATNGMGGLIFSLKGIAAGIALLAVPYMMSGMGAGDVKLMGAVGGFLGAKAVIEAFLLIALFGGIYSVALILIRRDVFKGSFSEKLLVLSNIVALKQYVPIVTGYAEQKPRLKYGVAIALGTITYLILKSFGFKFLF